MNERAVEVLVDYALRGVKQIRGALRDDEGGFCAMGVLIDALSKERGIGFWIARGSDDVFARYGINDDEWERIVDLNNIVGLDFVGIARKLGPDASGGQP